MDDRISPNRTIPRFAEALVLALPLSAALTLGLTSPAVPQSFFSGWFGDSNAPPAPSKAALPYSFTVEGEADKATQRLVSDVSTLRQLQKEPPVTGESLLSLIEADWPKLMDALWGAGYYNAKIAVYAGPTLILNEDAVASPRAVTALEAFRNRAVIPLRVVVNPGAAFTLRSIRVIDSRTGAPLPSNLLPPAGIGINPGSPASSAGLVEAESRIVDHFRDLSYPLAKVVDRKPVVTHPARVMDITFSVDPGPLAPIGTVTLRGTKAIDPQVVRSFIYTEPGDPYSRRAISDLRRSVSRIEALGSVRVTEATTLDPNGRLPIFVDVTERPNNALSLSGRFSTTEGPGVRASYTNRNVFGGGEVFRLSGDTVYLERNMPPELKKITDLTLNDIGGKINASFLKPALWGTRNDLLADAYLQRDRTKYYTARLANSTLAVRHRFSDTTSLQGGVEFERGQTSDALGKLTYTLVGVPVTGIYDSTDSLTDPKEGYRFRGTVAPYPTFLGSSVGMTSFRAQGSTYYAVDAAQRYVLAGALGFGSIVGAKLEDIPSNRRFFAGGSGSVRGYSYRTLSPDGPDGRPIGGRSLIDGSLEARIKVTDTIGVVPFVDAGMAFSKSVPDFKERLAVGVGLGLRYNTGIGPIRVDLATPLDRNRSNRPIVLYFGFGQAF